MAPEGTLLYPEFARLRAELLLASGDAEIARDVENTRRVGSPRLSWQCLFVRLLRDR
jgi:hypothetical protein